MALNLAIKIALLRRGQTQRGLASVTDIPETRLSSIVRGRATPTAAERRAIAEALEESELRLFGTLTRAVGQ